MSSDQEVGIIMKIITRYRKCSIQVKASFWFLICAFLQKGISVITTPIFTRLLSTAEYGKFNVFTSWLGIITLFVSLNLSCGVYTQGLVKFEDEENVFSSALQGLSTILVVGWAVLYFVLRFFWNHLFSLSTVQMLSMLAMIWATAVFGFWAAAQRVHYQYKMLVFVTLVVSIAKPIVGVFFVIHAEDKVTARILGLAMVELIGYSALFWIQMVRGKKFFVGKFWKHALLFNIPLIPHYLSQTVLNSADRIMIDRMVGADEAGIYSLAYSISMIMLLFNTSLMQTISPWIYRKIKEEEIGDIAPVAYTTLIAIAIVNILLITFAPEVVAIFAPASYYDAIWVIPPVAMSVYFMYSYDLFAKFAFYYEKTKFIMTGSVIGAVLNIVLNYIFINRFGYRAAGYTTLVCYAVYSIGHYVFMNKVCDEFCGGIRPYNVRIYLLITVSFVLVGFALLFIYRFVLLRYVICGILFGVIVLQRKRLIKIF